MSIVINLVSPDTSWIMSDGLVIDSFGKKVRGNQKKYEILHPNLCIGYSRSLEFTQTTVKILKLRYKDLSTFTVEKTAEKIVEIAKEGHKIRNDPANFLVTGISESGKFSTILIAKDEIKNIAVPDNNSFKVQALLPDGCPNLDLQYFIQKVQRANSLDERVRKAMNQMLIEASKLSTTVNKTVFFDIIHRS